MWPPRTSAGRGLPSDVMSIYRHACWPDNPELQDHSCGLESDGISSPIAWVDGDYGVGDDEDGTVSNLVIGHGGFLSGAQRKYGRDDPRANFVSDTGNLHGVSADSPLP
jgi:hypothetical protein